MTPSPSPSTKQKGKARRLTSKWACVLLFAMGVSVIVISYLLLWLDVVHRLPKNKSINTSPKIFQQANYTESTTNQFQESIGAQRIENDSSESKDVELITAFRSKNFTDSRIAYELAKHRLNKRLLAMANKSLPKGNEDFYSLVNRTIQQQEYAREDDYYAPIGLDNLQQLRDMVQLINPEISSGSSNTTFYSTLVQYNVSSKFVLNLIRLPKSGSSWTSMIGRALVGCKPDGFPCCDAGRRHKACPRGDLFCNVLKGCVNHIPSYNTITNAMGQIIPVEPTITQLRDPFDRSLSGFFYNSIHRPRDKCFSLECFQNYIQTPEYQNIITKMLIGQFPYAPDLNQLGPINETMQIAKYHLCHHMSWFGLVDMPIASQLLLYESEPFSLLKPNPTVFSLHVETENNTRQHEVFGNMFRHNKDESYHEAREKWRDSIELQNLFKSFNEPDYELYEFAVSLFCARVEKAGLLQLSKYFDRNPFERCELFFSKEKYRGSKEEDFLCSSDNFWPSIRSGASMSAVNSQITKIKLRRRREARREARRRKNDVVTLMRVYNVSIAAGIAQM